MSRIFGIGQDKLLNIWKKLTEVDIKIFYKEVKLAPLWCYTWCSTVTTVQCQGQHRGQTAFESTSLPPYLSGLFRTFFESEPSSWNMALKWPAIYRFRDGNSSNDNMFQLLHNFRQPPVRSLKSFIAIVKVAANTTNVAVWSITLPVNLDALTDWKTSKSLQKSTININSGSFSKLWFIVLTLS